MRLAKSPLFPPIEAFTAITFITITLGLLFRFPLPVELRLQRDIPPPPSLRAERINQVFSQTYVTVSWKPVRGATHYGFWHFDNKSRAWKVADPSISQSKHRLRIRMPYDDTSLNFFDRDSYKAKACNEKGCSRFSKKASAW